MTRCHGKHILTVLVLCMSSGVMAQTQSIDRTSDPSRAAVVSLVHWLKTNGDESSCADQAFAKVALSKKDAIEAASALWKAHVDRTGDELAKEWTDKQVHASGQTMKFDYKVFGEKPEHGWSLYISMHGGGGTTSRVNDRQWQNQIGLYTLEEGIYVAPRAPTDTWNLWHQAHIDALLDRLIEGAVIVKDVNIDRVYIMGYSAGGDGVFQLAPRMADRWAAAAMMAGHPNEASPLGLRNIGFTLHMGGEDAAYNRNQVAAQWKDKLSALRNEDPNGYAHVVQIHEGLGHWMNREDAVAIPWMHQFTRTPWPDRVVWFQDDVTHDRFYWLAVSEDNRKTGTLVEVDRHGQDIVITKASGLEALTLLLNDNMMDLDRPVTVHHQGKTLFDGVVPRHIVSIDHSIRNRHDPELIFSAEVTVKLTPVE
ncbi:MAG: alpha/beta hydrolase [Phycisphaerae bacterium]|nr:alpha/beta hydrolase [Phycisphaerae bacterium]